jgi:hypothetical protein
MVHFVKKIIRAYFPKYLLTFLNFKPDTPYQVISYSQEGEDMVLSRFFGHSGTGFYVDIGAHHPFRYSNTYSFYKKGWRGINIDVLPGTTATFDKFRPRDINLELGIGPCEEMTYYAFDEPTFNTFSSEYMEKLVSSGKPVIESKKIRTMPLSKVFELHLPSNTGIDFFSIDVEGMDLEVLKTNNWQLFRPKVILIEAYYKTIEQVIDSDINLFLAEKKYQLIMIGNLNLFYKDTTVDIKDT